MPLVSDQLRYLAEDHPDAIAYRVVGGGELTFRDWDATASRFARGLIERGLRKGDRVALALDADHAFENLQAYMATHKAGGANVPVNIRLSPNEISGVLATAEPDTLVVSSAVLDRFRPAIESVASLTKVIVVGDGHGDLVGAAELSWSDSLDGDPTDLQVDLDETDIADILFTSGTTGKPKGVVARHNRATVMEVGRPQDFSGNLWMHASPLFTFAGISFIGVPPRLGMTGVYMPKFDAATWLDFVESERVMLAFLVPAMVELLIQQPDFGDRDLSSLMMVSVGSAPISPATLQRFHGGLANAAVSNSYSMTEAGQAYCVMPPEEFGRRVGSVGLPMPPLQVRIVDEDEQSVEAGVVGEIQLRNPGKEREYFNDPEATKQTWGEEGWLRTGDLGRLDEDGFLYIVGRMKDVIIRGGNNIYAKDVEDVLYELPGVQEAAVVGIPHQVLGEDVGAVIVVAPDAELSADDVTSWCEGRLADYKRPRQVIFIDEMPRNPMGKILKRDLIGRFPTR